MSPTFWATGYWNGWLRLNSRMHLSHIVARKRTLEWPLGVVMGVERIAGEWTSAMCRLRPLGVDRSYDCSWRNLLVPIDETNGNIPA
jgi:hypothetical protein